MSGWGAKRPLLIYSVDYSASLLGSGVWGGGGRGDGVRGVAALSPNRQEKKDCGASTLRRRLSGPP